MYAIAMSHTTADGPGCHYEDDQGCRAKGWGNEALCCGDGCQKGHCASAIWPDNSRAVAHWGWKKPGNCGAISGDAGLTGVMCCRAQPPSPPAPPHPPPSPPLPPEPECNSDWCKTCQAWIDDPHSKLHRMFGAGWHLRNDQEKGCWPDEHWFTYAVEGHGCSRNWYEGILPGGSSNPSPGLLGFDETILEFCSYKLGMEPWDGGDLNHKLAYRCVDANQNVLRIMEYWDMCVNMQWEVCALTGQLPNQDGLKIHFATAPKTLDPEWFLNPSTHPTWPCNGGWCDPNGFTVGDVFFVEVCTAHLVCKNGNSIFDLEIGEIFECEFDMDKYKDFYQKLTGSFFSKQGPK